MDFYFPLIPCLPTHNELCLFFSTSKKHTHTQRNFREVIVENNIKIFASSLKAKSHPCDTLSSPHMRPSNPSIRGSSILFPRWVAREYILSTTTQFPLCTAHHGTVGVKIYQNCGAKILSWIRGI